MLPFSFILHPPSAASMLKGFSAPAVLGLLLIAGAACIDMTTPAPLTATEVAAVKAELQDRSFRQFEPHIDGDPRKSVILDFFGPFSLWAQYAEGDLALYEWEIIADDYRVERAGSRHKFTLYPVAPQTRQKIPVECRGCIDASSVSVSVRNVFDPDRIEFRVNDPNGILPDPFPVFTRWTEFREDEWQD